ncbi:MAG: diguanylate cyclase [Rhizobacter sp.]|nr:diguanylate cyclase [Rhizobacter sp.]
MTSSSDADRSLPSEAGPFNAVPNVDARAFGSVLLAVAEQNQQMLSIKDIASGKYLYVNEAMAAWLGRSAAEIVGLGDIDLMDAAVWPALRAADTAAVKQTTPVVSEHRVEHGGSRLQLSATRLVLPAADGGAATALCTVWSDLTKLRQKDAQLERALKQLEQQQNAHEVLRRETQDPELRDATTGLYQRAHFEDQFRREADLSSREHREFALVSVALDPLSDEARPLGTAATTRVLEALGRLLRGNTRAMDASCRLNEVNFVVLLSGVGLATAHARMEGLRRQCATQIVMVDGHELGFTVSMGVASFPHTANSQEGLLTAADAALAEARRRGGNTVALAAIRFEEY